jgi:F-box-like
MQRCAARADSSPSRRKSLRSRVAATLAVRESESDVSDTLSTAITDTTPMSANLDLLSLPLELLTHIFALLDGHQIVRCIAVCPQFLAPFHIES